jgi:hypothetical protein
MTMTSHLPAKKKATAKNGNGTPVNLGFEQQHRAASRNVRGPSKLNKPRLMISYCHADKRQAEDVAKKFSSKFEVLIDRRNFVLSRSTRPEMERLVGEADLVLVLLSPDSVVSKGVLFELRCALQREKDELRKVLFAAMIRKCKPMLEWPSERLYANLHSDASSEFRKLMGSMTNASKRALPKAKATWNSDQLREAALASMSECGFVVRQNIKVLRRLDEHEDDTLSAKMVTLDNIRYYSAYLVTYLEWALFFYFPQIALNGRRESMFAHDRFGTRSQVDARLGGYIMYSKQDRNAKKEPMLHDVIRVVKRHKKVVDVILSPHSIGRRFAQTGDVQTLSWPKVKGVMFFHRQHPYVAATALPLFSAPSLGNLQDLRGAIRCLKAALRVELAQNGATSSTWHFLEPRLRWRSLGHAGGVGEKGGMGSGKKNA